MRPNLARQSFQWFEQPAHAISFMNPENIFRVVVPPNQAKERLDKFLARFIGSVSRARLQKVIEDGLVLVDGHRAKSSHLVLPNQKIDVQIPKPVKVDILPENIPLNILYEDAHLLVVAKPAGMVVHPAFANYSGTLVNALMHHCGELSAVGGRQRPGIVHRLDKDTSGVLVVAKDDAAHQGLSRQFREKTVVRIYQAIVWHRFRQEQGRIETFIARSPKNRKRMTVQPQGKLAITNYTVVEHFKFLSFVELRLETGRTHQIRVHLAYIGNPVFGDVEYGGRNRPIGSLSSRSDVQTAGDLLGMIDRQALHARTLGFMHPIKNEFMRFDTSLPADMQLLLNRLREQSL